MISADHVVGTGAKAFARNSSKIPRHDTGGIYNIFYRHTEELTDPKHSFTRDKEELLKGLILKLVCKKYCFYSIGNSFCFWVGVFDLQYIWNS